MRRNPLLLFCILIFVMLLSILPATAFAKSAKVARIGDTEYGTLQAAIDACPTDGTATTITMIADYTGDEITKPSVQTGTGTVVTGQNITLDLAGHTIQTKLTTDGNSYWYAHVLYVNGGSLTLTDSSQGQTGAIVNTSSESYFCTRAVLVTNGANFTMESGRITATSGEGMRIDNATVNLNGGIVEATTGSEGNAYGWDNAVAGIELRGNSTVTIDGATVISKGENAIFSDAASDKITIKSGVFSGNKGYGAIGGEAAQNTITVTGGYFNTDPTDYLDVTAYKAVIQDSSSDYDGYFKVEPVVAAPVTVTTLDELLQATQAATLSDPKDITLGADIVVDTKVILGMTSKLNIPSGYKLSVVAGGLFQNDGRTTNQGEISVSGGGFFSNLLAVEGEGQFSGYPSTKGTYKVTYPMDLEWISWLNQGVYTVTEAVLVNDIDMPDVYFDPIPNFAGTFNGNGKSISNLKLRSTSQSLGLFSALGDSGLDHTYVKDLTIDENLETVSARCGGLAATTRGKVHITGVTMNGSMTASGATYYFAPFVGYANNNGNGGHLYIADSVTNMTVTADHGANIGPIIGSVGNGQSFTIGVYNFKNTGVISAKGASNSIGYVLGYGYGKSNTEPMTIDVINYENTGSITNNYGTWSAIGTGANYLCCNGGNMTFTTTYISTDNTAYYHRSTDTYDVTQVSATGITLDQSWWQFTEAGETLPLEAKVEPENATDPLVWTSSDESVATVSDNGTVTAVGNGLTIIKATVGQYAATCAVRVTPNMGYNTFVDALMYSGTLDGKDEFFDGFEHDNDGRLIVYWTPQSGCRAVGTNNHPNASCDKVTQASYETPNRVNGGCAQYQITDAMVSGAITIKNVSFVYEGQESFWYDANGWNGTGAANVPGELQLENKGNITIENCAFDNVSLTPYHDGSANSYALTVTDSSFSNIQKAGLRGINSKQVTVTGCTFNDCAKGAVDFEQNNNRSNGDIVLENNVINGAIGFKLRNITNKVNVTGDDTRVNVTELFSYDTADTDVTKYLILSGGTYNLDPSNYTGFSADYVNYVAPDRTVKANENSTWTICLPLTIKANDQEITYGESIAEGTAQVTVTGLDTGLTLASVTLTPSTTDATNEGTITPSAAVVKNGETDITAKYGITYQTGALIINKAVPVFTTTPALKADPLTYSGEAQTLVSAGSTEDGELWYALGDENTVAAFDGNTLSPEKKWSKSIPSGTDAGTYYVWYMVVGDGNHNDTTAAKVSVTIEVATVTAPTIASKVYNGQNQTADVTVTDDTPYTVTTNNGGKDVTADGYDVVLTLKDTANYKWTDSTEAAKTLKFKITQATAPEVTVPTLNAVTYDPANKLANITLPTGWTWVTDTTVPTVTNSGYDAALAVDDANYNYTNVTGYDAATHKVTRTVSLTVNKADPGVTAPTAKTLTYSGAAQALADAGSTGDGTLYYAGTTETTAPADSAYDTNVPTATNAGTYYVWYKVVGDGNHNDTAPAKVEATIAPKSITGATVTLDKTQLTYNASEQTVAVTGVVVDNLTLTANDYTVSGNTGTDKNDYTVTVTGKGNFKDSATAQWKIVEKAMTVTTQNVSVIYDGKPHGIAVSVTDPASGATVQYGKTEGTYDLTDSPAITNVSESTLTVYFKVTAANYTDYEGSATVTIAKATGADFVAPTANTLTYTGEAQALVTAPASVPEGYTVQYSLDGKTYSDEIPTGKAAGDYTVKVKYVADANHADVDGADVKVTIAKKALTVTADAQTRKAGEKDPELTYKAEGLVGSDKLTGALSRVAGEDVGTYDITVGDLKASDNYELKFVGAKLTITAEDKGQVEVAVETDEDVPKIEVKGVNKTLARSLASDEEKQRIENGEDMKLTLEINNIEDTVSDEDKATVAKKMGEGDNVALYLDISMFKQIGDDTPEKVTELGGRTVTVTITIPEDQRKEGRTFHIVQVHDGEPIVYGPFTGDTITLELERFSTFALTYQDAQESIEITGGDRQIHIGNTLNLKKLVVIKPEGLKTTLTWKSSKPKIVSVSKKGVVKGLKKGKATITVTTKGGAKATVTVEVLGKAPTKVTLTGGTVKVGKTINLAESVTLTPKNVKTTLKWKSSKPTIADVDENGVVTGLMPGTATITVTTLNNKTAKATVKVTGAAPKSVKLTGGNRTIKVDEELDLSKAVKLTPKNATTTLKWKSSRPDIASVDKNGVVTGLKKGTTTITVTTANKKTAKLTVKVIKVPAKKIKFKKTEIRLAAGQSLNLAEYVVLTPKDANATYKWKSSNTKVASIDKNGVLKGKKEGKTTITVTTDNGKKAKLDVIVENKTVTLEIHYDESYAEVAENAMIEEAAEIAGE